MQLTGDTDINALGQDYGHVLPVKLLTPMGVNKYADLVHAGIRSTFRTPKRMWNIDSYGEWLDKLIVAAEAGIDLTAASSGEARLAGAWDTALAHASEVLRERLGKELDSKFQAAEWEEPIKVGLTHTPEAPAESRRFSILSHPHQRGIVGFLSSCFIYSESRLFFKA